MMIRPFAGRAFAAAALSSLACIFLAPQAALAIEYPIGKPQHGGGMEVGAVYLQPITMAPEGMMRPAADSDIHLEADIHALADNPNGFAEGEWMPYLVVNYTLHKDGDAKALTGLLMPMVASDGPHYGDNVKLMGPGKYTLDLTVAPPTADPMSHFGRHTDKETGVADWFKPFATHYEFVFAGVGKKGAY
jgi:periplasmic iron binding protein